jgi:peptidoglycan/xylan/chitin deacetylase (PgdA/CDA1 family)
VTSISWTRWIAKKSARNALGLGIAATGALSLSRALGHAPRVRVLTYHRFGEIERDPFCLPRREFEAQVRFLAETKRAISLDDLRRFLAGEVVLPQGSALVTIDDGFASTASVALPVLRAHGVPAVAFVTPSLVENAAQPERYMSWDELGQLGAGGIAVGAHGYEHLSLGRMSLEAAFEQGARARELLERRRGRAVDSFAYPYGTVLDFNAGTRGALARAGCALVFTSQHGSVRSGHDPHELPRIKVESGDSRRLFAALCDGAMDAWRLIDTALPRLQKPLDVR